MAKVLDTVFPISFSNSSLSTFKSCEFKGFRTSIQKLVRANSNPHLLAGGAFASACELSRKAFYNDNMPLADAIDLGMEFILNSPNMEHPVKTNERVALTFKKYIQQFPFHKEFTPARLVDGTHAIEYSFSLNTGIAHPDLPDRNILFTGKLDGLYEQYYNGEIIKKYILDEKTTGRVSRLTGTKLVDLEKEANGFRVSGQMIGYAVAAKAIGFKVDSALIRRVPILSNHEPAFELEIPITSYMMEQWMISTLNTIAELKEKYLIYKSEIIPEGRYAQEAFYPNYQSSCNSWGEPCRFIEGCMSANGETIIALTHKQIVSREINGERILQPLEEYKKELGID